MTAVKRLSALRRGLMTTLPLNGPHLVRSNETLRRQIGSEAFERLLQLLDALAGNDQPRMRDYLRRTLRVTSGEVD